MGYGLPKCPQEVLDAIGTPNIRNKGCSFCKNKEFKIVNVKNSNGEDNWCDEVRDGDCDGCGGCDNKNNYFSIQLFEENLNIRHVRKSNYNSENMIVTDQNSEAINIKFCPFCGSKLK